MSVQLGDVAEVIRGVSFDKAEASAIASVGTVPVLRAGNIGGELDLTNDLVWVPSARVAADQLLRVGDIVVCMSSGSASVVGKSARLRQEWHGSFGAFCAAIRPGRAIDSQYLALWLRSPAFLSWRDGQARGANIQNLRASQFGELQLSLPALAEQRRIAARLTEQLAAVERARVGASMQMDAARSLNHAQLQRLFACAQARLWPCERLGNVAEIVGGIQKSPARAPVWNHRPFLTVRNVQRGYLDLSVVERFEVTPHEIERLRLRSGDILVVEGNGSIDQIGRNALFLDDGQEWVHQNHVIRVRLDQSLCLPLFVSWYLNSGEGWVQMVEKAQTTSGLYTLSAGKVADLEVPVPSLSVQRMVISAIDADAVHARAALAALEAQLAAVEALPAELLREAFNPAG